MELDEDEDDDVDEEVEVDVELEVEEDLARAIEDKRDCERKQTTKASAESPILTSLWRTMC